MSNNEPIVVNKNAKRTADGDDVGVGLTSTKFTLKLAINIIIGLFVIIFLICPVTFYALLRTPPAKYFGRTAAGFIVELRPLDEAAGPEAHMAQWVSDAISDTLTFDHLNGRAHLTKASRLYFTKNGAAQLKKAIENAKVLQTVEEKTLILKTITTRTPLVTDQSVTLDGAERYEVHTTVLLTYYAGKEGTPQEIPGHFTLVRTPYEEHPDGLAIDNIEITEHLRN